MTAGGSYVPCSLAFNLRAGTGVIFDNVFSGYTSMTKIQFYCDRADSTWGYCGPCDGTSPCDGNQSGMSGYLCRDQIGAGKDAWLWTSGNPYPPQSKEPVYIWGNTENWVGVPGTYSPLRIAANRDYFYQEGAIGIGVGLLAARPSTCTTGQGYWATDQGNWNTTPGGSQGVLYKCVSTNNWQLYYTPYTYPHPLRTVPQAPKNLRIIE